MERELKHGMTMSKYDEDEYEIVYVASIRLRNGRRIYAYQYGKKAFPIKVRKKPN